MRLRLDGLTLTFQEEVSVLPTESGVRLICERFGYKLEAPHDREKGHADRAFALAIALPATLDFAMQYNGEAFEPSFSSVYDDPNPWECR